jgi:hypothetical protein
VKVSLRGVVASRDGCVPVGPPKWHVGASSGGDGPD